MGARDMILSRSVAAMLILGLAAGCTKEPILPGKRLDIRTPTAALVDDGDPSLAIPAKTAGDVENRAVPISLPAPRNLSSWPNLLGNVSHDPGHLALSAAPAVIWSVKIGQGNSRRHRITAAPVVAEGRIFTLDSEATVSAHSTSGEALWSADISPVSDRADSASGGGLAHGGGKVFVSSGFGTLTALDAATGKQLWVQKLDAGAQGAPTYADGIVYVTAEDDRGYAVKAESGKLLWQVSGTPDKSGYVGVASPAISGNEVVFPFSSLLMVAADRQTGERKWIARLAGQRPGRGYSTTTDITGEPVISGGVVYAGNSVGRTMARSMDGELLWTAKEGTLNPVAVAGGSVFLVSDENRLIRLDAKTGEPIWAVELPYYTKDRPKRRRAIHAHFGPLLAGGKLWLASSDGVMRAYDPVDGALVRSVELPGGAATMPVVVNGVAYVVNRKGQLLALR